ncbi:MAG TPA: hypothetical protein VI791_03490 [Patescibacteria group bacterium]|nr:hypothetical protein [Patescibacteria group bacterium]
MIRTQVFLPEETYQYLKIRALREKKPAAQVVREVLQAGMGQPVKKQNAGDTLLQLAKLGGKGPKDLSKNIDKYLYEE